MSKHLPYTIAVFVIALLFTEIFLRKYKKRPEGPLKNYFENIPNYFPLLGLTLTVIGILQGLSGFSINESNSLQKLIDGLSFAFWGTIFGIILNILYQLRTNSISASIQKQQEQSGTYKTPEVDAINALNQAIKELSAVTKSNLSNINESLLNVVSKEIMPILNLNKENLSKIELQINELKASQETEIKLLKQNHLENNAHLVELTEAVKNEQASLVQSIKKLNQSILSDNSEIKALLNTSNEILVKEFEKFFEILSENNTKALVEVFKEATKMFNSHMESIIKRLVLENFTELNNSVKNLNEWQIQNKSLIQNLINEYNKLLNSFKIIDNELNAISKNTSSLVSDTGKLQTLIEALNKVMLADKVFVETATQLNNAATTNKATVVELNEATKNFKEISNQAKRNNDATIVLINQIEKLNDFNSDTWKKYRTEMEAAINIIKNASITLSKDIKDINAEFYERLNNTFQSLDEIMATYLQQINKRRV